MKCQMEGFKDSFFDPVKVASAWKKLSLELESQAAGLKRRGKKNQGNSACIETAKAVKSKWSVAVSQIPSCLKQ